MYNMACVLAMGDAPEQALPILHRLVGEGPEWAGIISSKGDYFRALSRHPEFVAITRGGKTRPSSN